MNIVILGATGYLGKHLIKKLNNENNNLFLLLLKEEKVKENFIGIAYETEQFEKVFSRHTIHWLINCIGVYQNAGLDKMLDGNLVYPMRVFNCAIQNGVKNILNINTSLPSNVNYYSATKRQLGNLGEFYAKTFDINFLNLLVEMFYGPDEPKTRFISSLISKMINNETIELTEGSQYRDIIRVEDVCYAIQFLLECNLRGYNDIPVGTGEKHTIKETVEFIHKALQSKSKLDFGAVSMRKHEPDCIADMTTLWNLGYKNRYSWENGLFEMISESKNRK